ncbi:helix-turn-helix domain-containing protein [Flavobacterium sp. SM15]|uniref:helix-turn-helix domain-containing protein n=1 Tax=Flavobacterium sp. SM15 TaxID=2908005 RepID=UPI001EDBF693|nr:helix-turn-helix domain-containing protein [Flavobacterium sp. SM15]MCG2611497.1 helix-turn-helix domain-containing protein [Flavobacterium sp. SM15]
MKTFTNNDELTFTKNYTKILACKALCPTEKLIIARVLSWQQNDLICKQSNATLAKELGLSINTLKGAIKRLNRTPFFKSEETSATNEYDSWINSKEMIIDEVALFEFVSSGAAKPKAKKQAKTQETINPAVNSIEDMADHQPENQSIPEQIQPKQVEQEDDFKAELDASEDIYVRIKKQGYSDIEFKNNYGQVFYIPNMFLENWKDISTKKGLINKIKNSNSNLQKYFDYDLYKIIDNYYQS